MERIGFVTNNRHLKNELTKWFSEIPGEFEFVDLGPPATGDPPPDAENSLFQAENPDKTRLVIFDCNYPMTLTEARTAIKLPDADSVPWLAIGLEEHAHNPHAPAIQGANDLILTPLDRLVFLQKVEYLLNGDKSVTPSFLYLAKADLPVELGKAVHITHLSETSCTILAPRPLATGLEGTLISRIFGKGQLERVEVRAVESSPVFENSVAGPPTTKFEVRLRFFGIKKAQLAELRKYLSQFQSHQQDIPRSDQEPQQVTHIAVISPQSAISTLLRSSLEKLTKFEVDDFAGFTRFHASLVERKVPLQTTSSEPTGPASALFWSHEFVGPKTPQDARPTMPHGSVTLSIRLASESSSSHAEGASPSFKPTDYLLGASWEQWTKDLDVFYKLLNAADRQSFDEAIQWTLANSSIGHHPETTMTADVSVVDPARDLCLAKHHLFIRITLGEAATPTRPARIKIHLEDRSANANSGKKKYASHYEAVVIDGSQLTTELQGKLEQVREWLQNFDIRNSFGNRSPIIVVNANEDKINVEAFRGSGVRQLVYESNDRRYQAELFISLSRPELWTTPQLALQDLKADIKAILARPAKASAVSEVGLIVNDRSPWRPGTELLVLSPIWSEAPEGLWARLRTATAREEDFENEFIFFGVSDLVEKQIRRFAREDYIKKKNQGQT